MAADTVHLNSGDKSSLPTQFLLEKGQNVMYPASCHVLVTADWTGSQKEMCRVTFGLSIVWDYVCGRSESGISQLYI